MFRRCALLAALLSCSTPPNHEATSQEVEATAPVVSSKRPAGLSAENEGGASANTTLAQPDEDDWVMVSPDTFNMGSPRTEACRDDDEKRREVTLSRGFVIGKHEVHQSAFEALMGYNPSFRRDCASCPVDSVTHHEALAYCAKLSTKKGLSACHSCTGTGADVKCEPTSEMSTCTGYRLPTEAEWELAARAGGSGPLPGGKLSTCMSSDDVADRIAWYKASSGGQSHPVGGKAPNRWGIHDMAGNVYEWVADWYAPYPSGGTDPLGSAQGRERVLRGGSWYHNVEHARSGNRHAMRPNKRLSYVGFRCVRTT